MSYQLSAIRGQQTNPPTSPFVKGGQEGDLLKRGIRRDRENVIQLALRITHYALRTTLFALVMLLIQTVPLHAAAMTDYCLAPPFIVGGVKPNLLLMLDNSASMYDLTYIDVGTVTRTPYYCYDQTYSSANTYAGYFDNNACSVSGASCTAGADCPSGETCAGPVFYQYDLANKDFYKVASLPSSCAAGTTSKSIANSLFMCIDTSTTPKNVTLFAASGNYLNWLAASKFDVEKKILTGGKYVSKVCSGSTDTACTIDSDCLTGTGPCINDPRNIKFLQAESRGCVGRPFIKEALTGNYVEGGANTSLGITFGVNGPVNPYNPTAPSQGGQTYIAIYYGDYNQSLCQAAIDAIIAGHDPASIKKAVADCLSYTGTGGTFCSDAAHNPHIDPLYPRACTRDSDCILSDGVCSGSGNNKKCSAGDPTKINQSCNNNNNCNTNYGPCTTGTQTTQSKTLVVFNQSIQACWALSQGTPISIDEVNTVKNQCTDLYDENKVCNGGTNHGKTCIVAGDCPGGTCINEPDAIFAGNPALLCSSTYAGFCASTADNWATTTWIANGYASDVDCIIAKHTEFCNGLDVPPVVDPTDAPSDTGTYYNLPPIIGGIGLEAQLGQSINPTLTVQVKKDTAPTGLIYDFRNLIRMGMMSFNYNGSPSECTQTLPVPSGRISCPKKCSNAPTVSCTNYLDCPSASPNPTCDWNTNNYDGSKILSYIGDGICSITTSTACTKDSDCPFGQTCNFAGDHSAGLIKSIDDIKANSWTPFAEGFYNATGYFARTNAYTESPGRSRIDLRINVNDFSETKNPSQYKCQGNNVLLITDGMSTADRNSTVNSLVSTYNDGDGQITTAATPATTCPQYSGSKNLDDLAWLAKKRNIKDFTQLITTASDASQYITTRVVYTGSTSSEAGECNSETLMKQTALNGCGYSDSTNGCYQRAENPAQLYNALNSTFQTIAAKAASGTAASVLASGEGSGANLVQALFYPKRTLGDIGNTTEIEWAGSLKNLWYYIDPFLGNSSIREETNETAPPYTLNLKDDYIIHFFFDTSDQSTKAKLYSDSDGDGVADSLVSTVDFESVKNLWEAGKKLFLRNPSDRTIYTTTDGTTRTTFATPANATMQTLLQAPNQGVADRIISYVRGTDYNTKFCSSTVATSCTTDSNCPAGETCINYRNRTVTIDGTTNTWKLGDIINATPRIVSWVPLNTYHKTYNDQSYKAFIELSGYTNRGMVIAGANDGMLHAFRLGKLGLFTEQYKKADLTGTDLGKEEWAFIPKNALTYLKYMADTAYCHIYYIDATPYVFDASIGAPGSGDISNDSRPSTGSTWRTILIGGMRLGGACKDAASTYGVQTPAAGMGYSSYFALDITDTANPQVLWEFSNANLTAAELATGGLGFSTTGPAVVRVGGNTKNGKWFVVFGSGPTGPIDTGSRQFKGFSDQNLKLFVLDLKTGSLLRTIDTAIQYAFAGSMINSPIDLNQNNSGVSGFYQDDAIYFGYTRAETIPPTAATKWKKGGVFRLLTKESLDPFQWALSNVIGEGMFDNVGPVTASVTKLQNYKSGKEALWLYFGTGRYFYKISTDIDDADTARRLYGVKEPCFSASGLNTSCTTTVSESDLSEAATAAGTTDADGWYINLDSCTNSSGTVVLCTDASVVYKAERMVTDPLATAIGAVFMTTAKPAGDICEYGGSSHLWALKYDTGGALSRSVLIGKAIVQVSTGSIEEIDLKTAFTEKSGRRTTAIKGFPPAGTPPGIIVPPKPANRIIHMMEK